MKIAKLIELLTPYAQTNAEFEVWDENESEYVRYEVTGVKVLVAEDGAIDICMLPGAPK